MRNRISTLALQFAAVSGVSLLPSPDAMAFDINAYCQKVAEAAGGSYQILERCLEEEKAAKARTAPTSRDGFTKIFQDPNKAWTIFAKMDDVENIGATRAFWRLTKFAKPQDDQMYVSGKQNRVRVRWTEKLEWVAVYCDKTERSEDGRKLKSFAVTLGSSYLDKNGKVLNQYASATNRTDVQKFDPSNDDSIPVNYRMTIPGTFGELDYRIACELT